MSSRSNLCFHLGWFFSAGFSAMYYLTYLAKMDQSTFDGYDGFWDEDRFEYDLLFPSTKKKKE